MAEVSQFISKLGIVRMSKKIINRVLLLLVVAIGVFIIYPVVSLFIPRHGTVNSVSDLQTIYSKAGLVVAASFTNSLIQKFPFDGPIHWRLILFKEPLMILKGQLNTNLLHAFISANTNTTFLWSGAGNELEEGLPNAKDYPTTVWTNIVFKSEMPVDIAGAGLYGAAIEGEIDLQSGATRISSWGSDGPISSNK